MMRVRGDGHEPADGDRIDFITDDLAVADLAAAWNLEELSRHGILSVVDASNREGNPRFPGIRYHEARLDDPDERLVELLPGVVAFIDEARQHGRVLLHCVAGISRSPTLAICYLHERHSLSLPAAWHRVRAHRTQAAPHPVFLRIIESYYGTRIAETPALPASREHHLFQAGGDDRSDGRWASGDEGECSRGPGSPPPGRVKQP